MLQKGKFFSLFCPSKPEVVYFQNTGIYSVGQEFDFDEDMFHQKNFLLTSPFLFPHFLYSATIAEQLFEQSSLDYPVEVFFRQQENRLFIRSSEFQLKNPYVSIVLKEKKEIEETKEILFQKLDSANVQVPQDVFKKYKNHDGYLYLQQDDGTWLLQKNFSYSATFSPAQQKSLRLFSFLSLKNILSGEHGYKQLLEDIEQKKFVSTQPQRLGRLLQILRVANFEDEEKIFCSILHDDEDFFWQIQDELFHDDLLPYMNRKEVSNILLQVSDDLLFSVTNEKTQKKYKDFLSRRRYLSMLERHPLSAKANSSQNQSSEGKTLLWQEIQKHFEKKQKRFLFLSGGFHLFEQALPARNFSTAMYANLKGNIFVPSYSNQKLIIELHKPAQFLTLCIEQEKNKFVLFFFSNIQEGNLVLQYIPRLPQRIVSGMIDREGSLHEGLAIYLKKGK